MRRLLAGGLVTLVALTGCGDDETTSSATTTNGPTTSVPTDAFSVMTDAADELRQLLVDAIDCVGTRAIACDEEALVAVQALTTAAGEVRDALDAAEPGEDRRLASRTQRVLGQIAGFDARVQRCDLAPPRSQACEDGLVVLGDMLAELDDTLDSWQ